MSLTNAFKTVFRRSFHVRSVLAGSGDQGSGVGQGGGAGGSIREAGGKFGEREAAAENAYFKKVEAEQLEMLRKKHDEEIRHHEEEIQRHMDSIKRHRSNMDNLSGKKDKKKKHDDDD